MVAKQQSWWQKYNPLKGVHVHFGNFPQVIKIVRPAASGEYHTIHSDSFDGAKNLGEAGPLKHYRPDYAALRMRSWAAYLDSEVAQTVANRFTTWVIGTGLKLQSDPLVEALKTEKVLLDAEPFNEITEARWSAYGRSRKLHYGNMVTLANLQNMAFSSSMIGGDVLVVLRVSQNGLPTVQLIDGAHVSTPYHMGALNKTPEGNSLCDGIEIAPNGEHIAYHVKTGMVEWKRVEARSKSSNMLMAFMVYGMRYRLDSHRGMPQVSTVLETISKMERYKEATVGSAEEQAKVVMQAVHQVYSDGENPLAPMVKAMGFDPEATDEQLPKDISGTELANTVKATTNKQFINNPIGTKIEPLTSNQRELYFKDFYLVNVGLVCAAVGMPPEVALSKYDSNFSASRAALKDWEHSLNVRRTQFASEFLQPFYELWLHLQILQNKVQAPGYLDAFMKGNEMVLSAYRNARWTGTAVPHIDPVKEVTAERLKLGTLAAHLPLTTVERATEVLNGGDGDANTRQFAVELKHAQDNGLSAVAPAAPPDRENADDDQEDN